MNTDRYPLLVFDWDGTLLDSIPSIVACTRDTLERLDLEPVTDRRIRDCIGMDLRATVEQLVPGVDDELFAAVCDVYRELWLAGYGTGPTLFDGVEETLEALRSAGHRLAIATAKPRQGLDRDLERTGVGPLFDALGTVDGLPGKPHPALLERLLERLGQPAGRALLVGDSVHDMGMAYNAGVDAVGVATGTQEPPALLAAGAATCLDHVVELPRWLGDSGRRAAVEAAAGRSGG